MFSECDADTYFIWQVFDKTIRPNYDTSGQIIFVRFVEELKTRKRRHFEINWPLKFFQLGFRWTIATV